MSLPLPNHRPQCKDIPDRGDFYLTDRGKTLLAQYAPGKVGS